MGQLKRAPLSERLAQDLIPDRGGSKKPVKSSDRLCLGQIRNQKASAMASSTGHDNSSTGSKKYGKKRSTAAAASRAVFEENFSRTATSKSSKNELAAEEFQIREDEDIEPREPSRNARSKDMKTTTEKDDDAILPTKQAKQKSPAYVTAPMSPIKEQQRSSKGKGRSTRTRGHVIPGITEMMQGMRLDEELPSAFSDSSAASSIVEHLPTGREDLIPLAEQSNIKKVQTFHDWAAEIIKFYEIEMVGEGAFGQVFKVIDKDDIPSEVNQHRVRNIGGCILKVIPIRPEKGGGSRDQRQSTARDVATEVRLLKKMDELHGFTRFRDVYVVQGKMNLKFVDAWKSWKSVPSNESEIDPTKFSRHAEKQVWAIIEMDDAGSELERLHGKLSMFQVYDVFWSLALTLFKAEEEAEFEHRDLHVSNVCVRVREGFTTTPILDTKTPPSVLFGLSGLRTTIIDYTLSRAVVDPLRPEDVAYNVLSEGLFEGQGRNREQTWQFDTYRRMQAAVDLAAGVTKGPGRRSSTNKWSRFVPRTNVIWLTYLLRVLLRRAGTISLSSDIEINPNLQQDLRRRLEATLTTIGVEEVASVPESAGTLISLAVERGWLGAADVEEWKRLVEAE